MQLRAHGVTVAVDQLGPDFLLVNAPVDLPSGEASLVLQVDSGERSWPIHLPTGVSAASPRVAIHCSRG